MSNIWQEHKQMVLELESKNVQVPNQRLFHSIAGCVTESGELMDQLKKAAAYGKELDETNLKEEYGDLLWYIQVGLDELGCTIEEILQMNINKLRLRYGDKFSNEKANNRNLDQERQVLEGSNG